jgi:uncharacterized protein
MGNSESWGRSVAWSKDDPFGAEYAELEIGSDRMRARGTAIGSDPLPYRLDFAIHTGPNFVTSRVEVATRGDGWQRQITLDRGDSGEWSCAADHQGAALDLPEAGGAMEQFSTALDPDLGLCPVFNTMPVLRHRLFDGDEAPELLMVWISVPDLALYPSVQLYSLNRSLDDGNHLIHFEGPDPEGEDFVADIVFDPDGIVVDYPGIATRIR